MKLFIHRSGRTARAGKKGNCFVLLPPEEIAYLADLSVFVGRKYSNQIKQDQKPDDPNTVSSLLTFRFTGEPSLKASSIVTTSPSPRSLRE